MTTATSEDTEITLGTGKMLALFFALVALCAVFFAMGFSLGRTSGFKPSAAEMAVPAPNNGGVVRPSAMKSTATSTDSAQLKSVSDKSSDQTAAAPGAAAAATDAAPGPSPSAPATPPAPDLNAASGNVYYVQVAAVSKQEDADALVDALKKKQYPAFSNSSQPDKLFHVQLGPYDDIKGAEAMRSKLVADGYNPILKK